MADFDKPFHLYIDASDHAAGACLMQPDKKGTDLPVLFYSKKFSTMESRYCTTEREAYTLLLACRAFRIYLTKLFVVYSDH